MHDGPGSSICYIPLRVAYPLYGDSGFASIISVPYAKFHVKVLRPLLHWKMPSLLTRLCIVCDDISWFAIEMSLTVGSLVYPRTSVPLSLNGMVVSHCRTFAGLDFFVYD